jgi:naringenin degradation protein FdeH
MCERGMRAPRRIVTGHDARGRSVVLSAGRPARTHRLPDATFLELWSTTETPAPIGSAEERDPTDGPIVTPPEPTGTKVRIVDFEPRARSPMHRTESVDYGVVLEGTVVLVLDDGSETELGPGDVVVQRGTDHAWVNPSDDPARMVFVLVGGRFTEELRTLLPDEPTLFDQPLDR